MNVVTLDPTAGDPIEPDWSATIPGRSKVAQADRLAATQYWGTIIRELRGVNRLATVNGHAVKRLVLAWLTYDRAAAQVARTGPVVKAPRTGTPMHSPWYTAMIQAGKTAATIEAELAITPRSRGDGDPIPAVARPRNTGADRYLAPRPPRAVPILPAPAPASTTTSTTGTPDAEA